MADDDEDDQEMTRIALAESPLVNPIEFVGDGQQLIERLKLLEAQGQRPGLVLLDLNMPRKDGRQALAEIKEDPELRHLPVIVLTTSKAEEDVYRSYDLGASGFITKPVTFDGLVEVMTAIGEYWFELVEPPSARHAAVAR
ncbi:MAG: response regulator [Actinobacteria bacterium]|nr:response regulator [Actinomycetota bacterium]